MNVDATTHWWVPVNSSNLRIVFSGELLWNYSRETGELVADHQGETLHPTDALALYGSPFNYSPNNSDPGFLLLEAASLSKCSMSVVDSKLVYYYQPVHLRIGNFQVRMISDESIRRIEAESAIFLEAKTLRRYLNAKFFGKDGRECCVVCKVSPFEEPAPYQQGLPKAECTPIIPDLQSKLVEYDALKGFLYGWFVGRHGELDLGSRQLESLLIEVRNKLTGMRTEFEIEHVRNEAKAQAISDLLELAEQMAAGHAASETVKTVLLSCRSRFSEILRLQKLQEAEWPRVVRKMEENAAAADPTGEARSKNNQIMRDQLTLLKQCVEEFKEKRENIEKKYKNIRRPRKGTPDYSQKQELKNALEAAKYEVQDAIMKRSQVYKDSKRCEGGAHQRSSTGMVSEHATAVEGLFVRVNNALASAARAVSSQGRVISVEPIVPPLHFSKSGTATTAPQEECVPMEISDDRLHDLEKKLLAVLLQAIVAARQMDTNGRSALIDVVGSLSAEDWISTEGRATCDSIIAYLTGASLEVQFSRENRVLANLMAVAIRDSSPDDLRRLIRKKGVSLPELGFGLQGALLGFQMLPKTFTDDWYAENNRVAAEQLDTFLWSVVMPEVFGEYAPTIR